MKKIYLLLFPCFLLFAMPRGSSQIIPNDGTGSPDSKFAAGWQLIQSGVEENLLSVHFANPTHGYIGGALNRCLKSINGGVNWSPVTIPSYADFDAVWAVSASDVYVGGWDTVYATHNGGQTRKEHIHKPLTMQFMICTSFHLMMVLHL
ncbi:MAG: hypothetical protein IPH45_20820 [Bacteroidales bacterium]|nr:hypothetical protein [Bacteroidales bacterium]